MAAPRNEPIPPPAKPALAVVSNKPALPVGVFWEEPAEASARARLTVGDELVDALKANPGKWVRLKTYSYGSGPGAGAKRIKLQLTARGWETSTGKLTKGPDAGKYGLWLRWAGTAG